MCKPGFDRPTAWSALQMLSKRPWIGSPMGNGPDQRRMPEGTRIVKDLEESCTIRAFRRGLLERHSNDHQVTSE
jgi:hypothetical protein